MNRWDQPGVPHKGWACDGVSDLDTPNQSVPHPRPLRLSPALAPGVPVDLFGGAA